MDFSDNTLQSVSYNSDTIILSNSREVWVPHASANYPSPSLNPQIVCTPVADGFDLTYTFQNDTNIVMTMGSFYIPGIRFANTIQYRDFREDGRLNSHTGSTAFSRYYPFNSYSPTFIFSDTVKNYTIGINLKYPVIDYKHPVNIGFKKAGGMYASTGPNWEISCQNNKTKANHAGDIKPGESRTYILSVRIIDNNDPCSHWLQTLEPYREYFHSQFGQLKYERDARAIEQRTTGQTAFLSEENPYGFNANSRLDTLGFTPLQNQLFSSFENRNFKRVVVWSPTGKHLQVGTNYPFQFTSHWLEGDTSIYPHSYGHKMHDALELLPIFVTDTTNLGLWWGRSGQVMYDWDTPQWDTLEFFNPIHTQRGFEELDLAYRAGARTIGLDAFILYQLPWNAYRWLEMMHNRYPDIKFCPEQGSADFLHLLGAFFYGLDYGQGLKNPHYLANFLIPQNETWGHIFSADNIASHIDSSVNMGYVPIGKSSITNFSDRTAGESWILSNPSPSLGADRNLCQNEKIVLDGRHKGAINFLWQDGSTDSIYTVTESGKYWVVTQNEFGCTYSDTIQINYLPAILPVINGPSMVSPNDTFNLNGEGNNALSYHWYFGDNNEGFSENINHAYNSTGIYDVIMLVYNGSCVDTAYHTITVDSIVNVNNIIIKPKLEIFPNPIKDCLSIEINTPKSEQVSLSVYSLSGQRIATRYVELKPGINKEVISTKYLVNGSYYVRVVGQDFMLSSLIVVHQ